MRQKGLYNFFFFFDLQMEFFFQARSKLPKKRRRVLPVEQPRPKRCDAVCAGVMGAAGLIGNRRMVAATATPGAILKDTFGNPKLGKSHLPRLRWSRIREKSFSKNLQREISQV